MRGDERLISPSAARARSLTLFLIAGALVAVAAVTVAIEIARRGPIVRVGPGGAGLGRDASATASASSSPAPTRPIASSARSETVWAMRDRGDYPVLAARLAQLTEGLESLRYHAAHDERCVKA